MRHLISIAHLPDLHIRTDEVKRWPEDLWLTLSDRGLPECLRSLTRRLSLSLFTALLCAGRAVCSNLIGGFTSDQISSVRPAVALCGLLRSTRASLMTSAWV